MSLEKISQDDYLIMLKEYNITEKNIKKFISNLDFNEDSEKMILFSNDNYVLKKSKINGQGVFATHGFKKNKKLGEVVINNNRTLLARYVNHSPNNNTIFKKNLNNSIVAILTKDIKKGEEILVNYRDHTK